MDTELKRCPFCGCEAKLSIKLDCNQKQYFVVSHTCPSNDPCDRDLHVLCDWKYDKTEAMAAWNRRAVNEWIPVSKRLPEDRQLVLAYCGGASIHMLGFAVDGGKVDECDLQGEKNVFYDYDSELGYCPWDGVTHWMPLPASPVQ